MNVCSEKQAIRDNVRLIATIGMDMRGFKYINEIAIGEAAPISIGIP